MADKMHYTPTQLAYDYMACSGRISDARLTEMAPKFMAQVMAARATEKNISPIADPFDRAYAAAKEIEFSVPEFYNCSRILYDNLAANRSGKTAILCCERRVTYGELCAAAARVGNGLAAMGLGRGSRVLLLMHDIPEYVADIFGAMRAGFVPVLINTRSPAERVGFYAQDCGVEAAVISGELASLLSHESLTASRLRHIVFAGASKDMPNLGLASIHHSQEWIETHSDQLSEANTHRDEMAFWMYSSGSTGRPKGVVHLHHDMALHTLGLRQRRFGDSRE